MTSRVVRKLNTSINFIDWIVSSVAGLRLGWCMYYVSEDIDPTVLAGLGMYILSGVNLDQRSSQTGRTFY